jgi:hypothetical protein
LDFWEEEREFPFCCFCCRLLGLFRAHGDARWKKEEGRRGRRGRKRKYERGILNSIQFELFTIHPFSTRY